MGSSVYFLTCLASSSLGQIFLSFLNKYLMAPLAHTVNICFNNRPNLPSFSLAFIS